MSDPESSDRRGARRQRSRSRSRSPHRRRHNDDYHHDMLVVKGLPKTASESIIKRAFSDYGDVKRISIITDEVSKQSIGVAYVKFWSGRDASSAYDACNDDSSPVYVDSHKVSATWAKKDSSSSSSHYRSSPSISMSEIQQQIDWATANAQKSHHANSQGLNGFVLDPSSGYYYHAQSQVYYDPKSQLFYNCSTQAYYRWNAETNSYIAADMASFNQASFNQTSSTPARNNNESSAILSGSPISAEPSATPSVTTSTPSASLQQTQPTTAPIQTTGPSKPSSGAVKFSILGKKQSKDMDRWNRKKVELAEEESKVADAKEIKPINSKSANATMNVSNNHQGGIRPRLYVTYEKLACLLCQRKFKDERHLSRHELSSDLHKQNLNLDEYEQVQRLEKSAAHLGIDLQPKAGGPPPAKKKHSQLKRSIAAVPLPSAVPAVAEPEPEPFDESNIGNRLLQSMGWKQGEGLGKDGTGITDNVTAQIRTERAGLGCNPTPTSFDIAAGDNQKVIAAKIARARYESASVPAVLSQSRS